MKKILKYLFLGLGIVVILALIVPFLIPAETYKKIIISQIESKISAKIEIASLKFKILPMPGFTLKKVKLSNNTGDFKGEPIVVVETIKGSVSIAPLFFKKVIAEINLVKPEIYYRTGKDGRTNIDDLMQAAKIESLLVLPKYDLSIINNAWAEEVKSDKKENESPWKINLRGLSIKDGFLQLAKEGEVPTEVNCLDLNLDGFTVFSEKATVPIYLAAALLGSEKQNFKLEGRAHLNNKEKTFDTKKLKITIGEALFNFSGSGNLGLQKSADISLELDKSTVGKLLAFDNKIAAAIPKDISKELLLKTPISLKLEAFYKDPEVDIKKINLSFGATKITGNGNMTASGNMPAAISLNIKPLKISELKSIFSALAPLEGVSDPDLNLKISGSATNPKTLKVSGHVESDKIRYQEYEISNLKTDFAYSKSKLNLEALTGKLYGGALAGSGSLAMIGDPAYEADVSINGVDMAKAPATKDILKGVGTLKVVASGKGTEEKDIKKNLKARGSINLKDGDIPSLKLGEKIFGNSAWNILRKTGIGLNEAALNELKGLDASCKDFSLTFKVENGVITTPDVKWQHSKYRTTLSGSVTMDERLSYKGEFALLRPTTDKLFTNQTTKKILANKSGEMAIPFEVSGTVANPNVGPDEKYLGQLFGRAVKELVVNKVAGTVEKKIAPKAKDAGKQLLKGIFGK